MKEKYTFKGSCGEKNLLAIPYGERCLKTGNSMFKWFPNGNGKFMYEHECQILETLANIPGVVRKIDSGTMLIDKAGSSTSYPAIQTSYHKGKTIDKLWKSKQKEDFELSVLLGFCKEVLGTLARVEERSIVHNDLHPRNIIKTDEGNFVIIDFDNAVRIDEPVDKHFIRGTADYIAPEKKGGIITQASDVFSFGKLLANFYKRGIQLGVKYPEELKSLISCATNENSAERYQNFKEFIDAVTTLEKILQEKKDKKDKVENHADGFEDVCFKQEDDIPIGVTHTRSFDWAIGIYRSFTALFVIAAVFFFSLGLYILVRPDDGTPLLVNGYPSIKNDLQIVYNDIKKSRL